MAKHLAAVHQVRCVCVCVCANTVDFAISLSSLLSSCRCLPLLGAAWPDRVAVHSSSSSSVGVCVCGGGGGCVCTACPKHARRIFHESICPAVILTVHGPDT